MEPVRYEHPRRIWVEDGHVLIEGHDGATLIMTPEVAIDLGRRLGAAGTDSLINKIKHSDPLDGVR
jgi:hypothetical protein